MDYDYAEQAVASGFLSSITFGIVTEEDVEKMSVKEIEVPNDVIHPTLGIPSPMSSQCLTCDAKNMKTCEGHFGCIKFPHTILHPYFISDVAKILNRICVKCKSERTRTKSASSPSTNKKHGRSTSTSNKHGRCKYCDGHLKDLYPRPIFKVSSPEIFGSTVIYAKISERLRTPSIASDYWDFLQNDPQEEGSALKPYERSLSHAQVQELLKGINPKFIENFVKGKNNLISMKNFPVTPNSHRVNECGQQMRFDERTRFYRKLVDFKGSANELSARVLDCLKMSKLKSEKVSAKVTGPQMFIQNEDAAPKMSGLKFIKELILGKRSDHTFRMVVVGDPSIKIDEIGVPCHIAQVMQISEQLNSQNWENLGLRILTRGETYVRRDGGLVRVTMKDDKLQIGDTIHRPLRDGDIVLINRPPSIHPHSLIALSVKILPTKSILSLNPLICSPFRGDFDGDCYHGYVPQSMDSRVELQELVALDKQLIDIQSGQNLLSLTQDTLTAAHLVIEDGVLLNRPQMQQLQMFCQQARSLQLPAIFKSSSCNNNSKATSSDTCWWTGKQLFSLLLPQDFYYKCPSSAVQIIKGEVIFSQNASSWLRDTKGNLLHSLLSHCQGEFLDFLHAAQGVLSEWLSMRGLSVSLADMYLSSDSHSRKNLIDEVRCGLRDAEHTSLVKLLMVDSNLDFLSGNFEESESARDFGVDHLFYDRQKSAALNQVYVSAFKQVFKDIQNLFYQYASEDNSFLTMLKAGSKKSNLTRAVQHGLCLGLQHSSVTLSFRIPQQLSCGAWNSQKELDSLNLTDDFPKNSSSYIPSAVIQSSFLSGLNPLECFVHSLTNRDGSFGGHADISGTLTRRIMFFMRDLCMGYDGTVRSAFGNQVVQFSHNINPTFPENIPDETPINGVCTAGGQPVGSWAACAISEAAYSALDQPISALESSPLLNLKEILECGGNKVNNAASLFISEKLRRVPYGFEYAALEIKSHLERVQFLDIVSTVMIMLEPCGQTHVSSWACHFHINKVMAERKQIKVQSVIDALHLSWNSNRVKLNSQLPDLQITSKDCSQEKDIASFCINIRIVGSNMNSGTQLETLEDTVIPLFLKSVIKGSSNVHKVDILWKDILKISTSHMGVSGELYVRVFMSETCDRSRLWAVLLDDCIQLMDMIDWNRSYAEDIKVAASAFGIEFAKAQFLNKLASAVSDTGKAVLPEHLLLIADCLSFTGEFVALSASGLARQRKQTEVSSPFTQACFSSPSDCFINAAKKGTVDNLQGSIDALSWGNSPSLGTGAQFDIIYSGKGHEVDKPENIYNLLRSQVSAGGQKVSVPCEFSNISIKSLAKKSEFLRKNFKATHFIWMSKELRHILQKYKINQQLRELDEAIAAAALFFHPRSSEKIGCGLQGIKIGLSLKDSTSRCFQLMRTDGTVEEFSYHRCMHNALNLTAPTSAEKYQSMWLKERT
ncbi:DNA-directed RNA polymerase IV subunit 1-like isoform X2 [Apium graveolens]|uniref:DNA-directed RNA polymerase IV subunit 1-like isoform X2 n=1 Tax=Apium graveolens TaxID=4045 RepID=UPI003D7B0F00